MYFRYYRYHESNAACRGVNGSEKKKKTKKIINNPLWRHIFTWGWCFPLQDVIARCQGTSKGSTMTCHWGCEKVKVARDEPQVNDEAASKINREFAKLWSFFWVFKVYLGFVRRSSFWWSCLLLIENSGFETRNPVTFKEFYQPVKPWRRSHERKRSHDIVWMIHFHWSTFTEKTRIAGEWNLIPNTTSRDLGGTSPSDSIMRRSRLVKHIEPFNKTTVAAPEPSDFSEGLFCCWRLKEGEELCQVCF